MSRWPTFARIAAVAIAVFGVIDPAITVSRRERPVVAVVSDSDAAGAPLVSVVTRTLQDEFRLALPGGRPASATVIIGERIPAAAATLVGPMVAIVPAPRTPRLTIESLRLPPSAHVGTRLDAAIVVHARGMRGDSLRVSLHDGSIAVASRVVAIGTDDQRIPVSLAAIVSDTSLRRLRVSASSTSGRAVAPAVAEAAVAVLSAPWPVLSYDTRPAWMATFVRRALEQDPRFAVTSRVVTSRSAGIVAGAAPSSLSEASSLDRFAVVIVGAPELLTAVDVAGLERYLREDGGRVVLLLDSPAEGMYRRLIGGPGWRHDSSGRVVSFAGQGGLAGSLRASSLLWPAALPIGATRIAVVGERPLVWRRPIGAGEIVVSGALDAWEFRDAGFDAFWRDLVAGEAASRSDALGARLAAPLLAVGDSTRLEVAVRRATTAAADDVASTTVSALLEGEGIAPAMVRLWPEPMRGTFTGVVRGVAPGEFRLTLRAGDDTLSLPVVVDSAVSRARPADDDLLAPWVGDRGGELLSVAEVDRLPTLLAGMIEVPATPVRWHPMRSPWWLVPFALFLSAEWWSRRRRGAP